MLLVKKISWVPHGYQKTGIKFLLEHLSGALFLDPGLGKTSITLGAIKILLQKGLVEKILIIAPLRVCYSVWPAEIEKWKDFKDIKYHVLHGKGKHLSYLDDPDINVYIINPEGLDWLLDMKKVKTVRGKTRITVSIRRFKNFAFDVLVVDELSKFKSTKTNRYKGMKQVLSTFKYKWGLTGSPAANGLLDLFGQCFMLDEGRTLGRYISHYRAKYFEPSYDGFNWDIRPGADELIYERLEPLALRMGEELIDMPKLIENDIIVELPPKVRKIYDDLDDDLISKIEEGVITAKTSAVASMKCRQVANGGIYLDPEVVALLQLPKSKRDIVDLHEEKINALSDLVDELQGEPLFVAYDFGHDLLRLQKKFGKDVPYIGSGVSPKKSDKIETAWNNGEIPLLLGHPQSVAHGLNLQKSGYHVAFHSLVWSFEIYDQFIRRVRRQGNSAPRVFVHRFIAKDTIDESIIAALKSKKKGQNALFQALTDRAGKKRGKAKPIPPGKKRFRSKKKKKM